jgi:dihydrodipicolinate synthase/N-acetylneuraminate lyase
MALHGTLAAAVTPLLGGGEELDRAAFAPLVKFYDQSGLDGLLLLGTTGEGILLSVEERKRVAELYIAAIAEGRCRSLQIAVHCGAQNTRDTVELARHAAATGAQAVAVIGPPYFVFDEESLLQHFLAAARACAPLPFYAYEFQARAGYGLPVAMLRKLREQARNFCGLKVSNSAWDRFEPYLHLDCDVFVGPEALIGRGLAAGAKGVVSGLAGALPKLVVDHAARPDEAGSARIAGIRADLSALPFHSACKAALARQGVPLHGDVRAPLRTMNDAEKIQFENILKKWQIL